MPRNVRHVNLYNEIDPFAAAWLRNLISAGHIPPGVVDERSIADLDPDELSRFTQCHFFAGIGGWSLALQLAQWDPARPVWSGSCPCQPFSAAGKRAGFSDDRHLWPTFHRLIDQCRPAIVFGEQVASPDGLTWLGAVRADLEGSGYAVGGSDLCAAGVGAPHIRQRLWWGAVRMVDGEFPRLERHREGPKSTGGRYTQVRPVASAGEPCWMADADGSRRKPRIATPPPNRHGDSVEPTGPAVCHRRSGEDHGGWAFADWLRCRDGKWRPVEPGTFPLAHGVSGRVGRLRGYGNAIVPQVAAEFIQGFTEAIEDLTQ